MRPAICWGDWSRNTLMSSVACFTNSGWLCVATWGGVS